MHQKVVDEMRKTITNNDLSMIEAWLREQGRATIEAWGALDESIKATFAAVMFALSRERQLKRENFPVTRAQALRLEKAWSLKTASEHAIRNGTPRFGPELIHAIEINPRRRRDMDMGTVHTMEKLLGEPWETLIELVQGQKVPIKPPEADAPPAPKKAQVAPTLPAAETSSLPPAAA